MIPLTSYLRHLFTWLLTSWAVKHALPVEGLGGAVQFVADALVVLVAWVLAQYVIPLLKKQKYLTQILTPGVTTIIESNGPIKVQESSNTL